MKKTLLIIGLVSLMAEVSFAQRYSTEIFTSNEIQSDVPFGFNVNPFSLPNLVANQAGFIAEMGELTLVVENGEIPAANYFTPNGLLPEDQQTLVKLNMLEMDIYTPPATDDVTERPLIIFIHTGNFLPALFNGSVTGDKIDSVGVNLCRQWAKRGYVAASINYRLGWNPESTEPDARRGTLLQAVYRAIHDTQSAVRFLKSSTDDGNPYGIDPNKIALFGVGSGGYVAQAYITLDDYIEEIANVDKFVGENGPYIVEAIDGTIEGGPGLTRLPDPLQVAGISKEVNVAVNAGGALADISWLDAGEAPMITIHCLQDPFAPFDDGTVVVPTTNENVVDVSGGNVFIQEANDNGNNTLFSNIPDGDPFTDRARSLYGETFDYYLPTQETMTIASTPEGLYPLILPINTPVPGVVFFNQGSPWDWWDFATLEAVVAGTNAATGASLDAFAINQNGVLGNPGMSPVKGLAYIDTIQGYANPRIMCALELDGNLCALSVSENELDNSTQIFPNPATSTLHIKNYENVILRIELIDITGRIVKNVNVNANEYRFERGNLNDGVYLLQIIFEDNRISKKVLFN